MNKPVIIGVSVLALLASATLLFAQTATGSSLITQMKAGARAFNANLLTELNGTVTNPSDYNSSPLTGKETGDMLTAGEWNRVLELVAQGGGGGGGTGGGGGGSFTCSDYETTYSAMTNTPKSGDAFCQAKNETCVGVFYFGLPAILEDRADECSLVNAPGKTGYTQSAKVRCCSISGGGGGTTPPAGTTPACTVRAFSLPCSNQAPAYSCTNARNNCQAQPGFISANDDGNGVNRHIDCTVCQ